ncbi:MAG: endopeptidase La [bacterium]
MFVANAEIRTVPMLPMREEVIFPGMTTPFFVGRKASMEALDRALSEDRHIFVVTQRNPNVESPKQSDLYEYGVLGKVLQVMRLPNGTVKALFEGEQRAQLLESSLERNEYLARIRLIELEEGEEDGMRSLVDDVRKMFDEYTKLVKNKAREEARKRLQKASSLLVADLIAPVLDIGREQKQQLLEALELRHRLELVRQFMRSELEINRLEDKLKKQVEEQISRSQKETYLQDQLRSIQKELGQADDGQTESEEMDQKITEAKMPEGVEEEARKELKKLQMMSPLSSEANVVRNYLEWLVSMPWSKKTQDNFDLIRAQKILDEDHYGLEKVKERIVEYLAVAHLRGSLKGPIICLTGPPGVGKTSLAKSIARALDRKFVRMSLGGVRDEAEIRGHRRTYIGALPGKIIQSLRKAGSNNPVLLIDEIDKLYQSVISDPSAAMLEVLDPEQNNTFTDHYLEVEYDLSDVLFICTANSTQQITAPLLDRMEVIRLSGYTELEKIRIAEDFIIPRQRQLHGLTAEQLRFRKAAVEEVIRSYTREAGVRNLERELGKICRKVVTQLVRSEEKKNMMVTPKLVHKCLGVPHPPRDRKNESNEVGVAMGLGVTSLGGETMLVEVGLMPGGGKLSLTGKLGDVMQESAKAAYSWVRSNADSLRIDHKLFKKRDLHIHLPEGATPKDGPSAGLPLITAIVSAFTQIPVRNEVAMTGEITLRGHVTEIGGLKEKLLAARRGMFSTVVIPVENEKDLAEIPAEITDGLRIRAVHNVNDALNIALEHHPALLEVPTTVGEELPTDGTETVA